MWIRNQDKSFILKDPDSIFLDNVKDLRKIYAAKGSNSYILGKYSTRERSLEVLDEMQKHLVAGSRYDTLHNGRRDIHEKVFNMPQK